MRKRLVGLTLLVLILSLGLVACGGGEETPEAEEPVENGEETPEVEDTGETLVVGMEAGYAPFNWTQNDDSNGAVQISGLEEYAGGYDVEIAKIVAEELGRELVIEKLDWGGLPPAVNSGIIDAIMAGMSPTDERREVIDFSDSYYTSDLVVIVKKGSEFEDAKTLADLSGAKITGQQDTFHYEVIDQIEGVEKETAMQDFPSMRVALESGIIDGYISERPEGMSVQDAGLDFSIVELEEGFEASEDERSIAVGLIKDSDLTERINEILAGISAEERSKIMEDAVANQPINQ